MSSKVCCVSDMRFRAIRYCGADVITSAPVDYAAHVALHEKPLALLLLGCRDSIITRSHLLVQKNGMQVATQKGHCLFMIRMLMFQKMPFKPAPAGI